MTSKHKSEDYKISAVEYYLVGDKSQLEVCEIFKCSPRSLMRWVEKYEKDGKIKREDRRRKKEQKIKRADHQTKVSNTGNQVSKNIYYIYFFFVLFCI